MSDENGFSGKRFDPQTTDIKEIEAHYYRLISHQIQRAHVPTLYGWTNKVLLSLSRRLGKTPLEIGHVAEDLEIPIRTLQSHLSQEGTNFSVVRDRIRHHYAIEYLLAGKQIEEIFPILDFKDRTGFINAFKRWTGLPPSHFRKLYNVYVRDKSDN